MEVKKLTESAILSSLFIVCSIIFVSTGLMYGFYLDIIVPIFIAIIYLRCDFKYTILAMITCVTIIGLVLGDIASAIWMSQSMLIGVMCGNLLNRKTKIFDDLVFLSIFSSIIIILIDIYLSKLTGFGLLESANETIVMINEIFDISKISSQLIDMSIYLSIAAIPLGTALFCYIGTLIVANKLNILKENSKDKFNIGKNIRNNVSSMYCSKKVSFMSIIYIILITIIDYSNIKIEIVYLEMLLQVIKYVLYYFVLKDLLSYIKIYTYTQTKSMQNANLVTLLMIISLMISFRLSFLVISLIYIKNRVLNKIVI